MPKYNGQLFSPPAPVAHVSLRNPDTGESLSDVMMQIDLGADISLLPQPTIALLGIQTNSESGYELEAFDGTRSEAQSVQADLIWLRKTFKGRFALVGNPAQTYGILGRDILNHLRLLLDGPNLQWDEFRLN